MAGQLFYVKVVGSDASKVIALYHVRGGSADSVRRQEEEEWQNRKDARVTVEPVAAGQ
jgi:hypothetical protein